MTAPPFRAQPPFFPPPPPLHQMNKQTDRQAKVIFVIEGRQSRFSKPGKQGNTDKRGVIKMSPLERLKRMGGAINLPTCSLK